MSMASCSLFQTRPPFPLPLTRIRSNTHPACILACSAIADQTISGTSITCSDCKDKGWIICGFCNGQKTDVPYRGNRFYRRCPTCKAVGVTLCSKCRVFKCVTLPDVEDA